MYKNLFIVRHAKSSWENSDLIDDVDRPLNLRGTNDAVKMSKRIDKNLYFNKILSSCAIRALHTANIFVREMNLNTSIIEIKSDLYHASADKILENLQKVKTEVKSLALFAHNPGINEFAYKIGFNIDNIVTTGVLHLQFKGEWNNLSFDKLKVIAYDFPKRLN